jgi:hypothetical protein
MNYITNRRRMLVFTRHFFWWPVATPYLRTLDDLLKDGDVCDVVENGVQEALPHHLHLTLLVQLLQIGFNQKAFVIMISLYNFVSNFEKWCST